MEIHVVKRNGNKENLSLNKIVNRIKSQCYNLNSDFVDYLKISQKVINGIYNGIKTSEIDNLISETAASLTSLHHDYSVLAARIAISNLHKKAPKTFYEAMYLLNEEGILKKSFWEVVQKNREYFNRIINKTLDFDIDYFGFKTLEKGYLLKNFKGEILEIPQYMYLRCAIEIHHDDLEAVKETYNLMSNKYFTHATPTLYNSGLNNNQLASCFLLDTKEDSIEGIFSTMKNCAEISKNSGGIGLSITKVRAKDSLIKGTNGKSNGVVPMLKVFNEISRYVNQGGKRKGSIAVYIEPWHADIFDVLDLKKNHGKEEQRARDLFYALWIPDLFMKKVEADEDWCLFCPNEAPGLNEVYGEEFDNLYLKYELSNKYREKVKARKLWEKIIQSQIETGTPYLLYKDAANKKSNQKNLGTIKSSNLCAEIIEYTDSSEIAVCNLTSISLPKFVNEKQKTFDYEKLGEIVRVCVRNLNKIINNNFYPLKEAERSNKTNRPIGIGVQGLADVFMKLRIPFDSQEAKEINAKIFETMYYFALDESCNLSEKYSEYDSFQGSPASQGILQFDLWNETPHTDRYNWEELKEKIKNKGLINSLLLAQMPTASTSQILGNTESIEPLTSNIFVRHTLSGSFVIINRYLVEHLIEKNIWNDKVKDLIILNKGSLQNIKEIPDDIKQIYKNVWEISQKTLIDMSADRGRYICQSQSLNLFVEKPDYAKLTSMHFYAWKSGLKTGCYYLRTKAAADPIQFTIDKTKIENQSNTYTIKSCSLDDKDCESCSS